MAVYDARFDLNKDGIIDEADKEIFLRAYLSMPGKPNWNPEADFDGNGQVTSIDFSLFAEHLGAVRSVIPDEILAPVGETLGEGLAPAGFNIGWVVLVAIILFALSRRKK